MRLLQKNKSTSLAMFFLILTVSNTAFSKNLCDIEKQRMYYATKQVEQAMNTIIDYLDKDEITESINNELHVIQGALLLHEYDVGVKQSDQKKHQNILAVRFCKHSEEELIH